MMLFLAIPGLVIGAIVFVARDVYVALVAQNFFAVLGILQNADTGTFRHPFVWAYAIAALAAAAFVASRRYFTPPFLRTSGVRSGLRQ